MKHFFLTLLGTALFISIGAQHELQLAEKQYELKAFDLAIKSFEKYIEEHPDDPQAWLKLADAHRHVYNLETARSWYRKAAEALELKGEHILLYGHLLCELGEYEKAKNWYANYASVDPAVSEHFVKRCEFAMASADNPPAYRVRREYMNTAASDFGASYWENEVVYASSRDDIKREFTPRSAHWTGKAKHQLFITQTDKNGFLKQPEFLRSDLKHMFNEAPLSFAPKNNLIAYTRNNFSEGTRQIPSGGMQLSLFTAKLKDDGEWVDIKAFPFNYGTYSNGYPCLTPDGRKIYYASNRPDGYGGYDIYVSYNVNGTWSIPENMGPEINTAGNEITPFLENGIFYFASDYHYGLGGFDIFKATSTSDGNKWMVEHMGTGINSTLDDYGLIYDSEEGKGYFTTNRGGQETLEDIYQFTMQDNDRLIVQVFNENDEPLSGAELDLSPCGGKTVIANQSGSLHIERDQGNDCVALIRMEGFKSRSLQLDAETTASAEPIKVVLQPAESLFTGKVIDAQTAVALEDVMIRVVDLDTYQKINEKSGDLGSFKLDLEKNKSFTIVFSKPGYMDFSKTVTTMGSTNSDLGNITMKRAGTNLAVEDEAPSIKDKIAEKFGADETDGKQNAEVAESNQGQAPKAQPVKAAPRVEKDDTEAKPAAESEITEAFAVQVEAIFGENKPDLKKYADLAYLGYVYTTKEDGAYKVRLGMFEDHGSATTARKEIVDQGYKNAFVVSEKGNKLMHKALRNVSVNRKATDNVEAVAEDAVAIDNKPFKIRLAAYQNPRWFQRDKVKHIAPIIEWPKDEWTIMILDGFDNKESAKEALTEVKAAGFDQAYIVTIDKDNNLQKVD